MILFLQKRFWNVVFSVFIPSLLLLQFASILNVSTYRRANYASTSIPLENERQNRLVLFLLGVETDERRDWELRKLVRMSFASANLTLEPNQQERKHLHICSLQQLLLEQSARATMKNTGQCILAYTFLIMNNNSNINGTGIQAEEDLLYLHPLDLNDTSMWQSRSWWKYAVELEQSTTANLRFQFVATIGSGTMLFPADLQDLSRQVTIHSKLKKKGILGRTFPYTIKKRWTVAPGSFHGIFSFLSMDLARQMVSSAPCNPSARSLIFENHRAYDEKMVQTVEREGLFSNGKSVQVVKVSPKLQAKDSEDFLKQWNAYQKGVSEWKALQLTYKLRVRYVLGKFGREPAYFTNEIAQQRSFLVANGFDPGEIAAYDTYPSFIVDDRRWIRHLEFTRNASLPSAGGGYWFFKAPLILNELNTLQNGDFLVWTDADLWDHIGWLPDLIETMIRGNKTLALYWQPTLERRWTKRDVYERFCLDVYPKPEADVTRQYAGNFIVMRKSAELVNFMNDWESAVADYQLLNDSPSVARNIGEFRKHRHDQSLLNAILKCRHRKAFEAEEVFPGALTLREWYVGMFPV